MELASIDVLFAGGKSQPSGRVALIKGLTGRPCPLYRCCEFEQMLIVSENSLDTLFLLLVMHEYMIVHASLY